METKQCSKCQEIKPIEDFIKNKHRKDGLSCYCKNCNRIYFENYIIKPETIAKKKSYKLNYDRENKENINAYAREYWKINAEQKREYRKNRYHSLKIQSINYLGNKCFDCGISYNGNNACIFQFHHREPDLKENWFVVLLSQRGFTKIKIELDKCDLLCANCHFLRHNDF